MCNDDGGFMFSACVLSPQPNRDLDMFINASKNFNLNITWAASFTGASQEATLCYILLSTCRFFLSFISLKVGGGKKHFKDVTPGCFSRFYRPFFFFFILEPFLLVLQAQCKFLNGVRWSRNSSGSGTDHPQPTFDLRQCVAVKETKVKKSRQETISRSPQLKDA